MIKLLLNQQQYLYNVKTVYKYDKKRQQRQPIFENKKNQINGPALSCINSVQCMGYRREKGNLTRFDVEFIFPNVFCVIVSVCVT